MKRRFLFLGLLLIPLFSCQRELYPDLDATTGEIEVSLVADLSNSHSVGNTKAEVPTLEENDFKIEIINSNGDIFKRWSSFSEVKGQKLRMNAGNYVIRAIYGDSTAVGFNAFYYLGEQDFVVEGQKSKGISVVCSQGNVKVRVVFGTQIQEDYTNYWATVKKVNTSTLTFSKDETESGYIPAGALIFRLHVIDGTGAEKVFKADPILCNPKDFMTFNVDTKAIQKDEVTLSITIDETTVDVPVNIEIPSYMLPKNPPTIVTQGFDSSTGSISIVEGVKPESASLNLNSEGGIKSCTMTVNSSFLSSIGWPTEIDFFNMTTDVKNILLNDGLQWTENMSGLTLANISFENLAKKLQFSSTENANNTFTISVSDSFDQRVEKTFTITTLQSQIAIADVVNSDVWSTSAKVVLTATAGDATLLYPEINKGTTWSRPAYTVSVSGNTATFSITGLSSATNYSVRARYFNTVSTGKAFTTETQAQVGNSGFEDWNSGERYTQPIYYPWTSDQWWDTNNNATMPQKYSTYINFKCFPTTWFTTSSRSGAKAAQVRSIAVNGGNSELMGSGKKAGKLFIGVSDDSGNITTSGHAFTSRPTKLEFYYKYEPEGTDTFSAKIDILNGTTVIGTGTFTLNTGSDVTTWTKASTDITYSNTTLKATSILIEYLSSTASQPACSKQTITIPAGNYKVWTGSCLTIDDVNLIYEK